MKPCCPHQTKEIPKASAAHQTNAFGEKKSKGRVVKFNTKHLKTSTEEEEEKKL